MKKAIIMVRVSTDRQEVETQKTDLQELAKIDGFETNQLIYIEGVGASAIKLNEKYLQEIEELKETILSDKDITTVYAWEISRIGRNEEILFQIKNFLIENKIQLVIKNPSLRLLNADGSVNAGVELAFSLFATLSKQEMEQKKQRFKRGKERNKAEGKYNGGFIKFGYFLNKDKYFEVQEDDAKVVREIFTLFVQGYTMMTLYDLLQKNKTYKKSKVLKPNNFTRVRRLLTDRAYIGENYPRIISDDIFQQTQEIIEKRKINYYNTKYKVLTKGLVIDKKSQKHLCAKPLRQIFFHSHDKQYKFSINCVEFVGEFCANILLAQYNASNAEKNADTYKYKIEENNNVIALKNKQIKECTSIIDRAIEMNINNPQYYGKEKLNKTIKEQEKMIEKLKKEIEDYELENEKMSRVLNGNAVFLNQFNELSDEKKAETMNILIEKIEIEFITTREKKIFIYNKIGIPHVFKFKYKRDEKNIRHLIYITPSGNIDLSEKLKKYKRFNMKEMKEKLKK